MELALVFLIVVVGAGAIVYSGMRNPRNKSRRDPGGSGDSGVVGAPSRDNDIGDSASDGGGDGGGGGGD